MFLRGESADLRTSFIAMLVTTKAFTPINPTTAFKGEMPNGNGPAGIAIIFF